VSDRQSSDERRRTLAEKIAQEEQRISEIPADLERRHALVFSIKEQLAAIDSRADGPTATNDGATTGKTTPSSEEKVQLFGSLFRGRQNVFARRWDTYTDFVSSLLAPGSTERRAR
jgi:hypothetical protein